MNQPQVREAFAAAPGDEEVVVEVAGCDVCRTDLPYLYDGVRTNLPLPLTLGHEISGRAAAAGAGAESPLGRAVVIPAVLSCGARDACEGGRPNICRKQPIPGSDIQGGFASSHIVVPARGDCPVDEVRLADRRFTLEEVSVAADAVTTPYQAVLKGRITEFCKAGGLPLTEWTIFECSGIVAGQTTAFGLLIYGATLCVVGFTMKRLAQGEAWSKAMIEELILKSGSHAA